MFGKRRVQLLLVGLLALGIVLIPRLALAQETPGDNDAPHNLHELWRAWEWEPGTAIGLLLSAWLYAAGVWRMWRASGIGRGIKKWEAGCYAGGWLVLFIALATPLHPLGEILFSAHMVQHELLMLIAAPLMVVGRPMLALLRGLPGPVAARLGRFSNTTGWKASWGLISTPLVAWIFHALVLWVWHAPALFQATLASDWIHALQHLSFLGSALLFWWAIFHGHRGVTNYGVAVLYLFTTAIHSGLLGALLTFARTPWYPAYSETAAWGLTGLEDQQLGGLIMWVPACTVYILVGLVLFAKWMKQSEVLALRQESARSVLGAGQSQTKQWVSDRSSV